MLNKQSQDTTKRITRSDSSSNATKEQGVKNVSPSAYQENGRTMANERLYLCAMSSCLTIV